MALTEKRKKNEIILQLREMLAQRYSPKNISGTDFFAKPDGGFFRLSSFPGEFAAVMEYCDNLQEAEQNSLEDGDLFYLNSDDISKIFQDIVAEIEA